MTELATMAGILRNRYILQQILWIYCIKTNKYYLSNKALE